MEAGKGERRRKEGRRRKPKSDLLEVCNTRWKQMKVCKKTRLKYSNYNQRHGLQPPSHYYLLQT